MGKVGMTLAAIALLGLGLAIEKWRFDTCRNEGLSATYCWQRVLFK